MKRVMVVCSGNICRSPMAHAFADQMLKEANIPAMVISAGTLQINGAPADSKAVQAMDDIGIDISHHRSQGVQRDLCVLCDYILVMEPMHERYILDRSPELKDRIRRVWEYSEKRDVLDYIPDPKGLDQYAFNACRNELEACVKKWVDQLIALSA